MSPPIVNDLKNKTELQNILALYSARKLKNVSFLLPALFTHKGNPLSLDRHFPMEPLFKVEEIPMMTTLQCGRQVSKCFVDGWVTLDTGRIINALDVRPGMRVLSYCEDGQVLESRRVIRRFDCGVVNVVRVSLDNGEDLVIGEDHAMRMWSGGYRAAKDLRVGDSLCSPVGGVFGFDEVPACDVFGYSDGCAAILPGAFRASRSSLERAFDSLQARCASDRVPSEFLWGALCAGPGHARQLAALAQACRRRTYRSGSLLHVAAPAPSGTVFPTRVTRVRHGGSEQAYDFEVERNHNYVLNHVVSHNSTSLSLLAVLKASIRPHLNISFVLPLFEQVRRLSTNVVKPLIMKSSMRHIINGGRRMLENDSVLQRTFANGSNMFFLYAQGDADRIRGLSNDEIDFDEVQDHDEDSRPEILATMDASDLGIVNNSGTPKTPQGPLSRLFEESSQGHWAIKCTCGFYNIASGEHHLIKMIRPAGPSCVQCGRLLDMRSGRYLHAYPSRLATHAGYHQPQVIFPMHYGDERKWRILLDKMAKWPEYKFRNEVLGLASSQGSALVPREALERCGVLPWAWDLDTAKKSATGYSRFVVSADWGLHRAGQAQMKNGFVKIIGGGTSSFTCFTVLGFKSDHVKPYVVYAEVLSTETKDEVENERFLQLGGLFNAEMLVHDQGGAGIIRHEMLRSLCLKKREYAWALSRLIPMKFAWQPSQHVIRYVSEGQPYYSLDKTRALMVVAGMINRGDVHMPKMSERTLLIAGHWESLILVQRTELIGTSNLLVTREGRRPDDFCSAVTMGCFAAWHRTHVIGDVCALVGVNELGGSVTQAESWDDADEG